MKFPQIMDNRRTETRLDFVLNHVVLPFAEEVRIAAGYFYVSGYELVRDGLRKNPALARPAGKPVIRFLISPRTDRLTAAVLSMGHKSEKAVDQGALRRDALQEFEIDLAGANLEAAQELVNHLTAKTVSVRLCVGDFFHAKAYLIRSVHSGIDHHYSIVGSSNFSVGGLTGNHELNLGTEEAANYDHLIQWFDEIWDKHSVEFSESLIRIIESSVGARKHAVAQRSLDPFGMLLFLVRHYLGDLVEEQLKESDQLAEFQRIGAENVLKKLEDLGGAIVSDSVGLGKTYTAGEVVRRYRAKDKKVLIVAPPYVLPQWKDTLSVTFGIPESAKVTLLSQGKLAQMKDSELERNVTKERYDLIVVDEAHRARNPETQLHRNIKAIRGATDDSHVLLLTATPFNNSVGDLASLVEMAVFGHRLTNQGYYQDSFRVLRDHFRKLRSGVRLADLEKDPTYGKARRQVQDILNGVMLLRMRSTIKERYKEVMIAGKPLVFEDPTVDKVSYRYTGAHHKILENLGTFLEKLKLPHILMANPESSGALSSLYRLLLFKRIESSLYAFYVSLQNIKVRESELREEIGSEDWDKILERYNQRLLETEEDHFLISDAAARRQNEAGKGKEKGAVRLTKEDVLRWIDEDTAAIDAFVRDFFLPLMKNKDDPLSLDDPKMTAFLDTLRDTRFRKALVFTEYIATGEYLARRLEQSAKEGGPKFRFAAVSADTKEETINSVLNRFAPIGRRVKNPNPAQELDVLISTDMLSEGVNLQDADLLINFDLPWNPMRIVQRVGRVNRIGSDNVVRVLNFVPDEVLEQFLNLVQILSSKIAQVTALLGKEMAILSSDDEEIEARDIGESIRKVQASKSVSDIELLARKSTLFSAFEGETPEDFFRMELFVASKRAHVRPSDFLNAPADDGKTHYYCAVSSEPKAAYRLYEIYGKRDHQHDRLARFWLCAGTTGAATASDNHPTEFLRVDPAKEGGFNAADFKNADAVRKMEEEINKAFEQRVEERRDMNSPRNLARRAQQIGGRQKTLATQIDTLIKQGGMGDSFVETAAKQRPDAERLMGDLLNVMESHELAARHLSQLARALADKSIDPSRSEVSPAQFRDLAGVLFDFYDSVVLKDAALRGHLYTRSEIDGRAVATIYL